MRFIWIRQNNKLKKSTQIRLTFILLGIFIHHKKLKQQVHILIAVTNIFLHQKRFLYLSPLLIYPGLNPLFLYHITPPNVKSLFQQIQLENGLVRKI